jgi:hypothetical protein
MRTESCVQAISKRRKGLITRRQLEEIGLSSSSIARRVRNGQLYRKYQGVYAVGRPDLSIEGEMWAAALAVGEHAVIGFLPAAYLWGFWTTQPAPPFDVVVARRVRGPAGVRVHCVKALPRSDWTWWRGVPVTTAVRTVLDLDSVVRSENALRRAVHEAQSLGRLRVGQLEGRATGRLAKIIAAGPRPTRSALEDAVDDVLTRHGIRPPQTNVGIPGLPAWVKVDFLYPEQRLVIEADGARYHDTEIRRAQDRRKQAILEQHGLRVLRLRWEDTTPPAEAQTVARVRHALAS